MTFSFPPYPPPMVSFYDDSWKLMICLLLTELLILSLAKPKITLALDTRT